MRKAFNFYRSYYEVAKELSEKDRAAFLWALIEKQFEGKEPNLSGLASFAYLSQKHSIDMQVIGFETKTKTKLDPCQGGTEGGCQAPSVQGKEKGKEKEDIDVRKRKFADTISFFVLKYGSPMCNEFYSYWTEPNKSGTKLRFEMEKTWELERRLERWKKNNFNKQPPKVVLSGIV